MNASKSSQIGGLGPVCSPVYDFGPFRLDPDNRLLLHDGQAVPLTPKAFDTLLFLFERNGRLVTKDELMTAIWPDTVVCDANLTQTVFMLRKALGESAGDQRFIITVPGSGYRFAGTIETTTTEQPNVEVVSTAAKRISERSHWHIGVVAFVAAAVTFIVLYLATAPLPPPSVEHVTQLPVSKFADPWQHLVTDGARIFFLETTGDQSNLVETSVAGGGTRRISQPFPNAKIHDISRDKSEFLIGNVQDRGSPEPFWIWPVQGGPPTRVGNISGLEASWTPDGHEILYALGQDLRKVRRDGSDDRLFLHTTGRPVWIRFSPDRKRIRFTLFARDSDAVEIWEANSDGTNPHPYRLTGERRECCGNWTEDGRYFIFTAYTNDMANLWVVRETGKGIHIGAGSPVQLTSGTNALFEGLPVSRNRIFSFVQEPTGESVRYDLNTHEFTGMFPGKQIQNLGYSRNGKRVAYELQTDGSVWVSKPDGSDAIELFSPPNRGGNPRWSPDGRHIAFEGHAPDKWLKALVVNADGGPVEQVLPGDEPQGLPAWSSDGKSIAVAVDVFQKALPPARRGIFIVDAETRQTSKLDGSDGLTDPTWSPDGRYFIARTADNRDILQWDPAAKEWRLIVRGKQLAGPVWSWDSKYLYYQDVREAGQPVYRLEMGKPGPERVVSFEKLLAGGIQRCILQAMTPDGGLVVFLIRSNLRIHALDLRLP